MAMLTFEEGVSDGVESDVFACRDGEGRAGLGVGACRA